MNNYDLVTTMKHYISILLLVICVVCGCNHNAPSFTTYTGVVVEKNSLTPIPNLKITITDGNNIYGETETDKTGQFSIDFAHNATLGMLYLFIDGEDTYPSKKLDLIFTPESNYDYGLIYLYDQTDESLLPIIGNVSWSYPIDNNQAMCFNDISIVSPSKIEESYVEVATTKGLTSSKKFPLQLDKNGKYYCIADGLIVGQTYYFQVVATNTIGTSRSDLYCRVFGMSVPMIVELKSATVNSAIISIKVTEEPLQTLEAGICWSATSNLPTIDDDFQTATSITEADVEMTNLDFTAHSYYVRAFSKNSNGVAYSDVLELPINNPYNLPTFQSGGFTYNYKYMGRENWYTAYNTCQSLVLVFDDWTLPSIRILPDLFNTYYQTNGEVIPLPLWSMQNYAYWEDGESGTFMLTTNGEIIASKSTYAHYFAVRKLN